MASDSQILSAEHQARLAEARAFLDAATRGGKSNGRGRGARHAPDRFLTTRNRAIAPANRGKGGNAVSGRTATMQTKQKDFGHQKNESQASGHGYHLQSKSIPALAGNTMQDTLTLLLLALKSETTVPRQVEQQRKTETGPIHSAVHQTSDRQLVSPTIQKSADDTSSCVVKTTTRMLGDGRVPLVSNFDGFVAVKTTIPKPHEQAGGDLRGLNRPALAVQRTTTNQADAITKVMHENCPSCKHIPLPHFICLEIIDQW